MSNRRRATAAPEPPRYVETWLAAVMADASLPDRAARVAYALARHADWTTGGNCWPSVATLAREAGVAVRKVARALLDLEHAGYLERTGVGRPRNVTDYRLTLPASTATGGTTEAVSSATGGSTESGQFCHSGPSVLPLSAVSSATGGRQPHLPPPTIGGGVEEEAQMRPAPDARDTLRATAIAELLPEILPESWATAGHGVNANDPDLGAALAELLAEAWTPDNLRDACADVGKPKGSPTRLLTAHLRRSVGKPPPALVRATAQPTGQDKPKGAGKPKGRRATYGGIPAADLVRFANDPSQAALRDSHRDPATRVPAIGAVLDGFLAGGLAVSLDYEDDTTGIYVGPQHDGRWFLRWDTGTDGRIAWLTGGVAGYPVPVLDALAVEQAGKWPDLERVGGSLVVGIAASPETFQQTADDLVALADRADQLSPPQQMREPQLGTANTEGAA